MNYFTIPGLNPFKNLSLREICDAMCDELEIDLELLRKQDRHEINVFYRVVFCRCVKNNGFEQYNDGDTGLFIHRNRSALTHYRKIFSPLYQSKQSFRDIYMKVESRLTRESYRKQFGRDPLETSTDTKSDQQPTPTGKSCFRFDIVRK